MRAFLLVFDETQVAPSDFRNKIDTLPSIESWTLFFGNAMCLASEKDVRELSKAIRHALPDIRCLITAIDPEQKGGWLPKNLWTFINKPASWLTSYA